MMNQVDELNRARARMAGGIRMVIADGEDLLKAAADVSGEGFAVARARFAEKLGNARARLADASQAAVGTSQANRCRQPTITCMQVRGPRSVSRPLPAY